MDSGLLITELQGMHAGANAVSGDFSLSAKGFMVEAGKISKPVEQITVAGNFFALLKDVEAIGNDVFTDISSYVLEMPSMLIGSLSVAGKE
jgi:PmbA protein